MKQLILTSKSDFSDIRRLGGLYIDKTKEIYDCIGSDTYYFISRPRRFGKSLLCSTLRDLFFGKKELFKGLWIENSDWQWQKHPVIHLSMIMVAGEDNSAEAFKIKMLYQLNQIATSYNLTLPAAIPGDLALSILITSLYEKTGQGVVVIIDEYDKPILDLVRKPAVQQEIHSILRTFYGILKGLETSLRFVF